jgi:MerR family transcriptional regulator/heat shock protein HspR
VSSADSKYGRFANGDGGQAAEDDALDGGDDIITGSVDGSAGEDRIVGELRPVARPADTTARLAHKVALGLSQIAADRPIFTLSVAADLLGLHPRTLRIYEEKGLVVPARTEGNRRRYSQNDIQRFQFIRQLTRGGVNLEGVRIILDMADELAKLGGNPEEVIERHAQTAHRDEP